MAGNNKIKYNVFGRKYNRLTIISEPYSELRGGKKRRFVYCECECGKKTKVILNSLMSGSIQSCGCINLKYKEKEKARLMRGVLSGMRKRCEDPKHEAYHRYGGRGIKICPEWKWFGNFYNDMHETWQKGLEIDRINSDGNYEKSNCRWVDELTQQRNKSSVVFTEETARQVRESDLSQNKLAEIYNVNQSTISRIKNNQRWK